MFLSFLDLLFYELLLFCFRFLFCSFILNLLSVGLMALTFLCNKLIYRKRQNNIEFHQHCFAAVSPYTAGVMPILICSQTLYLRTSRSELRLLLPQAVLQ